jgi:outer membrane biosynthesis protein TonB
MKRAALLSALLHFIILSLLIFGLPWLPRRTLDLPQPIAVAMVPVGELTTMTAPKPKPQEKKKPEKEKPKPPKPEEKPKPEQKEPPKPEPEPEVMPEPKPAPKEEPKPAVKPAKKEPKPEPKAEKKPDKKIEKKKEKPKKEKAPEKKDTQQDFLSVLKNLKKSSTSEDNAADASPADATESMNRGALSDTLTMSELDALRRQIAGCWSIPAGIQQAEDLAVEIAVSVNPDMTVREAKIIDTRRLGGDPHFRVAAESALRAVLNPQCSPLKLPPNKYQQWKEFTFVFNPKDML